MIRRILVTGGRDYRDRTTLHAALEDYPDMTHLAQGGADGADALARQWALRRPSVVVATYPAHWKTEGRMAGPLRNQRMLDEFRPDLVVAFPGGRGTADMVMKAKAAGVPVKTIR